MTSVPAEFPVDFCFGRIKAVVNVSFFPVNAIALSRKGGIRRNVEQILTYFGQEKAH